MLFASLYFLFFMLLVLAVYHGALRSWPARKTFLLVASWFFYWTWSPPFLPLLIGTTWLDFQLARWIYRMRWRRPGLERPGGRSRARRLLVASLAVNLTALGFFKYGRFLWQSVAVLGPLPPPPGVLSVVVPLGISFYTFHSISYVIDTYRGVRPPTDSFRDFALYVAFFPQLIAGPITRWGFFGPQLVAKRRVDLARVEAALFLVVLGLVKKVLCADALGSFVDGVYVDPGGAPAVEAWIALYAYAFQIYFDFSGYTDIAWGLAGLLGFALPENFRHPYLAVSPREFWQRWHVSLSTWLRDYLYVGLGGNRRGSMRTYANLLVTMVLGGLWHGAAWTFVLWGAFHGAWLALHRAVTRDRGREAPRTPAWLRRAITFHLVAVGWVVFRAGSLGNAREMLHALVAGRPLTGPVPVGALAIVLLGFGTHALAARAELPSIWGRVPRVVQGVAYGVAAVLLGIFGAQAQGFIYFQF